MLPCALQVAGSAGTAKAMLGKTEGKHVVAPEWLKACSFRCAWAVEEVRLGVGLGRRRGAPARWSAPQPLPPVAYPTGCYPATPLLRL